MNRLEFARLKRIYREYTLNGSFFTILHSDAYITNHLNWESNLYVNHQSLIKHDRKMFYKYVSNNWHYLLIIIKSNNQRFARRRKKYMNNNRIYNWKSTWRNVMNYRQFKCMVNDSKNQRTKLIKKPNIW